MIHSTARRDWGESILNGAIAARTPANRDPLPNAEFGFAGEEMVCDGSGVLYWPAEQTLLVSDLHLEKGSSFATRRIFVPPYDTGATLAALGDRLTHWQPKRVICLGDSFHDPGASERLPAPYRDILQAMMAGRDWMWIAGNHDPDAPVDLCGTSATMLCIGRLYLTHEPTPGAVAGEIAGHLHPKARIKRRGKSIRRRCVASDGNRVIMPSFGAFTGGLNVRDGAFDGLFDNSKLHVWMLGRQQIYRIGGNQLKL